MTLKADPAGAAQTVVNLLDRAGRLDEAIDVASSTWRVFPSRPWRVPASLNYVCATASPSGLRESPASNETR